MRIKKQSGFTLTETLITIAIIGIISILVIPGIITSSINKSRVALIQNTVGALNDAIESSVSKRAVLLLEDSDVLDEDFLKNNLQVVNSQPEESKLFASKYKTLNGTEATITTGTYKNSAKLKSGVTIAILSDDYTENEKDVKAYTLKFDVNGPEEPNIVGVDYFELEIAAENVTREEDDELPDKRVGTVSAYAYGRDETVKSQTTDCKKLGTAGNQCKKGNAKVCYYLLETEGFSDNYLESASTTKCD